MGRKNKYQQLVAAMPRARRLCLPNQGVARTCDSLARPRGPTASPQKGAATTASAGGQGQRVQRTLVGAPSTKGPL